MFLYIQVVKIAPLAPQLWGETDLKSQPPLISPKLGGRPIVPSPELGRGREGRGIFLKESLSATPSLPESVSGETRLPFRKSDSRRESILEALQSLPTRSVVGGRTLFEFRRATLLLPHLRCGQNRVLCWRSRYATCPRFA